MNKILKFKFLLIGLIVLVLFIGFLFFTIKQQNKLLKETINQLNKQIEMKTQEVETLEKQLRMKEVELKEIESRIVRLKAKKEKIEVPKEREGIVREFREMGYEAVVK